MKYLKLFENSSNSSGLETAAHEIINYIISQGYVKCGYFSNELVPYMKNDGFELIMKNYGIDKEYIEENWDCEISVTNDNFDFTNFMGGPTGIVLKFTFPQWKVRGANSGLFGLKTESLFEKSSFNELELPQKFISYLHKNVPIKAEEFSFQKMQKLPNSHALPPVAKMSKGDAYLIISKFPYVSALNTYIFIFKNTENYADIYTYIEQTMNKYVKVSGYAAPSSELGMDVFKKIMNTGDVYKVDIPEYKETKKEGIVEFMEVYGGFMTKMIHKYAKKLYDETLLKIKDKTSFENEDTAYLEKLYKSLKKLQIIYKEKDNTLVYSKLNLIQSLKDEPYEWFLQNKQKLFLKVLELVFDFGIYKQKWIKKQVLREPASYKTYKSFLEDPELKKELDYLERGEKTDMWSLKTENMKYLKLFEDFASNMIGQGMHGFVANINPNIGDIILVDTFFQTGFLPITVLLKPSRLQKLHPDYDSQIKSIEVGRVVGFEGKQINTEMCLSQSTSKEKIFQGLEDTEMIIKKVELTEEDLLSVIKKYPHLKDSLKCLLTEEELKEFGYLFRSDVAGLWGAKIKDKE